LHCFLATSSQPQKLDARPAIGQILARRIDPIGAIGVSALLERVAVADHGRVSRERCQRKGQREGCGGEGEPCHGLLRWPEVDWDARQIRKADKGGKLVTVPITPAIRTILWPLRGHHAEHVFTYIAMRTRNSRVTGQRYPLTYSGVKIAWRRLRRRAGVHGFRFHDFRHDLGTKLLRETGNLKLVQRALNHSDIKTTVRYAHVLDQDVADALERLQKSHTASHTPVRKVRQLSGTKG
jgi:hypothetical protein